MNDDRRIVLFSKGDSFAALSLTLTPSGGVIGFGAGSVEGLARRFAARAPQPVMIEAHGDRGKAIDSFGAHAAASIGNGWQIVYHGKPNFG